MSADRAFYLDSSAIVKLVGREPESAALSRFLGRRRPLTSSALARVEVLRAAMAHGGSTVDKAHEVLRRFDFLRINNRILDSAAALQPPDLRSLDAIHLATADMLGTGLLSVVTYDTRMADAARAMGMTVKAPH